MTALHTLRDTFDRLDPARWTADGATAVGGRLQITSRLDMADGTPAAGVRSVAAYDLRGSELVVELVDRPAGASHEVRLALYVGADEFTTAVGFTVPADVFGLECYTIVGGVRTVVRTVPVDRFLMRWLRIRERSGIVYWAASPDGLEWTPLTSWASTIDLSAVKVRLACWYYGPGDVAGAAQLDNLNTTLGELDPATQTGQPGSPYLAVDVQPDTLTGVFTVGVSKVNGPDVLAWSDTDPGAWENIVCDVTRLGYQRGAQRLQGALTRTEAGTCTLTLSDTTGAFDPMTNPDVIHKGTPLRVRAWGYDPAGERWDAVLFTCEVDELGVQYLKADAPVVTVTGVDVVGPLVAWQAPGLPDPGAGSGDDLLARVKRTLDEVGRGTVSPVSDQEFTARLAPVPLARPWEELSDATEAELGRLWVDRHNRLVVKNRNSAMAGPVRGTLSDVHGEAPVGAHCCVADAAVVYGVDLLANRALAGRRDNRDLLVNVEDEPSQLRYGVGAVDRRQLLLDRDVLLQPWAAAVTAGHSTPDLRVDSVQPQPATDDLDSALRAWPAVLRTDIGDRWLFLYRLPSGRLVERTLGVVGIDLDATPDDWTVRWTTTDAPAAGSFATGGWFTIGTSKLSGNDLLTPGYMDLNLPVIEPENPPNLPDWPGA